MYRAMFLMFAIGFSFAAAADEGMWTFDNFPRATVRSRYGVDIDQSWLDKVRRSTVRIEGICTASLVSPQGLVLTNHHCVRDCLQRISTPGRDTQATGFLAGSRGEEERCAAEQISVLTRIEDVTGKVTAAIGDKVGPESNQQRKAVLTRLEQGCEESYRAKKDPHSCEAVTLYGGGQYFLYHYKRYTDVRLVFAPEKEITFFGGDVDNFQFPRWNMDLSMLRVYENGKPAVTPDYLHWRRAGARENEPVFVPGHPGSTQRLETVAQLRFERNVVLNRWLLRAAELRGRYLQFAAGGAEPARIVGDDLFYLENSLKARRNQMNVLLDEDFLATKAREEQALRSSIAADPRLKAYGSAWTDIEHALDRYRVIFNRHAYLERGVGLQGELANYARILVRAAAEREKPNETRQREYTEAALPQLRQQLLAPQPTYSDLEILRLTFSLEKMVENLGVDDPVVQLALGRDSPRNVATRLIQETKLGDPAYRTELWNGGRAALEKSGDPLIALAMRLEPEAQQIRKRYEDEVESVLLSSDERIARARFAVSGTNAYPDATFTLRLSFGTVRGWREGDREVLPFTTMEGLFARATGQPPFRLPPRWVQAQDRLNLDTRFNFVTDNDIIGGNSGSPVLDAQGRLVGLIFDGNIHSLGGDFWFDPALNRAVAVHPAAMIVALSEIYGAQALVRELSIE